MIFQEIPLRCECCGAYPCLCGDCSGCSNGVDERHFLRNVKRFSILFCILAVAVGFLVFAPVVTIQTNAATVGMGSVTFCYLGQGALLVHGDYYPYNSSITSRVRVESTASCPTLRLNDSG
ncbi:MAG: hypothetical protein ACLP9K_07510 [Nitrososphaerales archaeon]|jgi:hypothetical protein